MARKKRSAKQLANDKRLGRMAKARNSKKVKRKSNNTKSMARRKTSRRRTVTRTVRRVSRGRAKFGGFLKRGIIGDTTSALGAGMLVGTVTNRVAPQATPFATLAAEFAAGGVTGMVAAEGLKSITGQQSILTGLIGGFGGGSQGPTGGAL